MNDQHAYHEARVLMDSYGLQGWCLRYDTARRRFGQCTHSRLPGRPGVISLSRELVTLNDWPTVRDVVLHEIAHALAGPGHGHDAHWRKVARSIGAKGDRCYGADVATPTPPYLGTCPDPSCDFTIRRYRRARASCPQCSGGSYNARYLLRWAYKPAAPKAAAMTTPAPGRVATQEGAPAMGATTAAAAATEAVSKKGRQPNLPQIESTDEGVLHLHPHPKGGEPLVHRHVMVEGDPDAYKTHRHPGTGWYNSRKIDGKAAGVYLQGMADKVAAEVTPAVQAAVAEEKRSVPQQAAAERLADLAPGAHVRVGYKMPDAGKGKRLEATVVKHGMSTSGAYTQLRTDEDGKNVVIPHRYVHLVQQIRGTRREAAAKKA